MDPEEHVEFYDVISDPRKRLAHEGGFLKWLLETAPGGRVLDMACGTGVQAEFLARNGALVTARDIDDRMIDRARADRAHERITYEVHDMREPSGGPFDLAIVMGNSISLAGGYDGAARALCAMSAMLSPRGAGFVQVVNYAALRAGGARHKVARKKTRGGEIVIVKDMVPAEGAGALVSFAYFSRKNQEWQTSGSQSALPDLSAGGLGEIVRSAGLLVEAQFGDYDRSPYDEDRSPDLLLVLRK